MQEAADKFRYLQLVCNSAVHKLVLWRVLVLRLILDEAQKRYVLASGPEEEEESTPFLLFQAHPDGFVDGKNRLRRFHMRKEDLAFLQHNGEREKGRANEKRQSISFSLTFRGQQVFVLLDI